MTPIEHMDLHRLMSIIAGQLKQIRQHHNDHGSEVAKANADAGVKAVAVAGVRAIAEIMMHGRELDDWLGKHHTTAVMIDINDAYRVFTMAHKDPDMPTRMEDAIESLLNRLYTHEAAMHARTMFSESTKGIKITDGARPATIEEVARHVHKSVKTVQGYDLSPALLVVGGHGGKGNRYDLNMIDAMLENGNLKRKEKQPKKRRR